MNAPPGVDSDSSGEDFTPPPSPPPPKPKGQFSLTSILTAGTSTRKQRTAARNVQRQTPSEVAEKSKDGAKAKLKKQVRIALDQDRRPEADGSDRVHHMSAQAAPAAIPASPDRTSPSEVIEILKLLLANNAGTDDVDAVLPADVSEVPSTPSTSQAPLTAAGPLTATQVVDHVSDPVLGQAPRRRQAKVSLLPRCFRKPAGRPANALGVEIPDSDPQITAYQQSPTTIHDGNQAKDTAPPATHFTSGNGNGNLSTQPPVAPPPWLWIEPRGKMEPSAESDAQRPGLSETTAAPSWLWTGHDPNIAAAASPWPSANYMDASGTSTDIGGRIQYPPYPPYYPHPASLQPWQPWYPPASPMAVMGPRKSPSMARSPSTSSSDRPLAALQSPHLEAEGMRLVEPKQALKPVTTEIPADASSAEATTGTVELPHRRRRSKEELPVRAMSRSRQNDSPPTAVPHQVAVDGGKPKRADEPPSLRHKAKAAIKDAIPTTTAPHSRNAGRGETLRSAHRGGPSPHRGRAASWLDCLTSLARCIGVVDQLLQNLVSSRDDGTQTSKADVLVGLLLTCVTAMMGNRDLSKDIQTAYGREHGQLVDVLREEFRVVISFFQNLFLSPAEERKGLREILKAGKRLSQKGEGSSTPLHDTVSGLASLFNRQTANAVLDLARDWHRDEISVRKLAHTALLLRRQWSGYQEQNHSANHVDSQPSTSPSASALLNAVEIVCDLFGPVHSPTTDQGERLPGSWPAEQQGLEHQDLRQRLAAKSSRDHRQHDHVKPKEKHRSMHEVIGDFVHSTGRQDARPDRSLTGEGADVISPPVVTSRKQRSIATPHGEQSTRSGSASRSHPMNPKSHTGHRQRSRSPTRSSTSHPVDRNSLVSSTPPLATTAHSADHAHYNTPHRSTAIPLGNNSPIGSDQLESSPSVYSQHDSSSEGTISSDEEARDLLAEADSGPRRQLDERSAATEDVGPSAGQVERAKKVVYGEKSPRAKH